ncbi:hypothetical protein [Paenimyroides aestuarii]|uniref:Lipoprotein n=1 Tax=Paenimyroides aestuarii TaxID=2968490 RepID=A0ABY5NVT2_9FLAO|nr:hypothetical protein [Paenimyroides aestuarii]UUV22659.1 hypothetical protein NPX36_06350 [Paenimyroides aestuarii]
MNKYVLSILSLLFISCNTFKSIRYEDRGGKICYKIFYNKKVKIKSLDGVEYNIYQFHFNKEYLYLTNDSGVPGENYHSIMKKINSDSVYLNDFFYNNRLPTIIEGKDKNGYYYNYTDTIINIGYSNVKSEQSKKYFDYIIKNIKKCNK